MQIRDATQDDWPAMWPFMHEIIAAGDTYAYDTDMTEQRGRDIWLLPPPGRTVVAVDGDTVLGTAKMNPNQGGPGSHIASASFMVDGRHRGRGVGRALGEYTLDWARAEGYRGMQFNAVVSANTPAVTLWQALGFDVIGAIPEGFRHPSQGYVDLYIMYRPL